MNMKKVIGISFLYFFSCLVINSPFCAAHDIVSMIRDMKGDVLVTRNTNKEKFNAVLMLGLEKGDHLTIGKGSGAKVLYYNSEIEERYFENSEIEIGLEKGIIHKGHAEKVDNDWGPIDIDFIPHRKPDAFHEFIGAFTLRGNSQPTPSAYFDKANINRYAVIIGISKFSDPKIPKLKYASRDAQSFYDYLISPYGGSFNKDNILLLKDEEATLKNTKDAITNFLKNAVDKDFVIIYIASHGEPEPDRPENLYLLTHDSRIDKLASTAYLMDYVNSDMRRYISAKRLIFLADACHAGGIISNDFRPRGFSNTINNALSALSSSREGWAMITASRPGEVSLESDIWGNGHGAFTYFLLDGLYGKADIVGNHNGVITISEAFDYLQNTVKYATHNAQHPVITGDFDNNLPIGFIPVEEAKNDNDQLDNTTDKKQPLINGTIIVKSSKDGANIFLDGKFVGKTSVKEPFTKDISAGLVELNVKKKGLQDYKKLVYINPNEIANIYTEMDSSRAVNDSSTTQLSQNIKHNNGNNYKGMQTNKSETKKEIDRLIKELEEMHSRQIAANGAPDITKDKTEKKKIEKSIQPNTIPISINKFTTNIKAISSKRDMDILRTRVIDELIKNSSISVVERDLKRQEEILREQRLGGSILADQMYRIELGKILGANFICFGNVVTDYDSDDLILQMEVVETATTLIKIFEHRFTARDVSLTDPETIASKISEIILK